MLVKNIRPLYVLQTDIREFNTSLNIVCLPLHVCIIVYNVVVSYANNLIQTLFLSINY